MLNVVLVDDEQLSLDYMKSIIDWEKFGAEIVAGFSEANEALRFISKRLDIDLVFLDMEMPEISGTDFIRKALSLGCKSKFVIVSAHDSFQYLQESLRLNVTDYLLKPARGADIEKILALLTEKKPGELYLPDLRGSLCDTLQPKPDDIICCFVMKPFSLPDATLFGKIGFRNMLRYDSLRYSACFCLCDSDKYLGYISELAKENGRWVGVSLANRNGMTLEECFINACDAYDGCFFTDAPFCIYNADYEKQLCSVLLAIETYIKLGKVENLYKQVDSFFEEIAEKRMQSGIPIRFFNSLTKLLNECSDSNSTENFVIMDGRHTRKKFADRQEMIDFLHKRIRETFENKEDYLTMVKGKDLIPEIKDYIEQNCQNDLSLSVIADEFALSPKYLSNIFKKFTGTNISHYINITRISRARTMLEQTDISVQDVSYLCGFSDCSYFTKVFKKHTGLSPSEYKQHSGKN